MRARGITSGFARIRLRRAAACGRRLAPVAGLLAAGFLALLAGQPAAAETARVRGGEHAGFTRLTVELMHPAAWELGRSPAGYRLQIGRPEVAIDLGEAFRRIGRARVAGLSASGARLEVVLACACHAVATTDRPGLIVLDIRDGPPLAGSPFERPLEAGASRRRPRPRPTLAGLALPGQAPAAPDPFLATYWRRAGVQPPPVPATAAGPNATGAGLAPPGAGPGPAAAGPKPPPAAAGGAGAAGSSGNDGAAGDPDAGGAADDPLAAARAELLFELARAAAQGMVEAAPPALLPPPPPAPEAPPGPPPAPVNAAPAVPIMVETGLDRAARGTPRIALTPGGGDCPEDAAFDVPAWGGEGGPADAIAARRAALIGEFDRPDPAAVLALARLYVHLGFGAEAGAALAAFGAGGEEVERLAALALLVDGAAAAPAAPFAGLEACDGAVALWAVLAAPRLETGAPVAAGAVVRGFSALPLHLRRLLGRPLADRFLDTGDAETARALRDAAERAGGPGGDAIDLVSARIALARGRVDEAEAALAALATRPGPEAAEALALLVETLLSRGAEVAPGHVTAAEAFAYELSGTATGTRLASAHARALAARGEHDAAFAALARMPPGPATAALADALHATLAAGASEASFLRHAFAALPGSAPAAPHRPSGAPARRALAGRLVGLGFGPEAQALLGPAAALPPGDRPLWAAAALAAGDPRAAVAALAGDGSAAAAAIRGDALSRLGDHRGAAAAFAGSDPDRAAAAGWRAAAGGGAASPPAVASALAALAPAVDGATPAEGGGDAPLAAARALLADSAARRTAAAVLLAAYPPP